MRINTSRGHLPLQHLIQGNPSVRSLERIDEASSKRLYVCRLSFPPNARIVSGSAIIAITIRCLAWAVFSVINVTDATVFVH